MIIILGTAVLFAQDMIFSSLTANSDGKNVIIEWRTVSESTISYFEVERASQNQTFKYISTEKAHGYASSYSFKDDNVFMKDDNADKSISSNNYSYRIKIVKKDNRYEYSNQVNVVHNISGIQKTWGMIKEMFR